jgi:tetratricopeptide (TPR) repeat protein
MNPAYAPARLNFARLLANMDQLAESETQAKAAVDADPNLPGAHELWGFLLSAKGDLPGAIRELQAALRIQPDSPRAHYELGLALGRSGRHAEAQAELKTAAASSDPEIRAAATEILRRLGQ